MAIEIPKLSAALERDIVDGIIRAVGRTIVIKSVLQRVTCSTCYGNDPFCPTCHGNPTTDVTTTTALTASVKWKGTDDIIRTPEGQYINGDCVVKFAVPLNNYTLYDMLLKGALSIEVDGRICVIDSWSFGGSPINRISVVLKVDDSTSGQRIGQ